MHNPKKVLLFCMGFVFVSLVFQGTLFQLWNLYRDESILQSRMVQLKDKTQQLTMQIKRVKDPAYLELEVREHLDLVEKGDLIFIFSSDN